MKKFMIAALAAGMLTACSDSAVVETPAGGGAQWGADGTGYVSLNISLPSSAVGRANDQFDDGLASEYKVKDAVLVLFKGATEDAATFVDAYKLPINFSATDPTQITSTSKITKRINAIDGNEQVYALVLLNAVSNGLFSVSNEPKQEEYKTSEAKIKQGGSMTPLTGKDFATVKTYIETLPIDINNGLIMLNAPLTNVGSTSDTPPSGNATILAKVDRTKIKPTASEAAAEPAAEIYVERNSAKVTLKYSDYLSGNTAVGNIPYQVKGIALDNTNTKSYIVRNVDGWDTWKGLTSASQSLNGADTRYRFAAAKPVKDGANLYRIYWAKDVNYATNTAATPFDVSGWGVPGEGISTKHQIAQFATSFTPAPATGYSDPIYCLENTFDVTNMDWINTTRAILKVHFGTEGDNVDMVMWNNDTKTFQKHADAIDAGGPMAEAIAGMSEFKAVAAYSGKTKTDISVTIAHEGSDPENVYRLATINVNGVGDVDNGSDLFKSAKEYFGAISYYVGGMGYYQVRIKHFMDDLTPWNRTDAGKEWTVEPKAGYVDKVYPGLSDANYLGRYGVVRNNWYNLQVTGVKIIGTPYIEDVTTELNKFTPDDEMKTYITVNINILSWAKRDQGVILE